MLSRVHPIIQKYHLRPFRYQIKGKITLIETNEGRFVLKEKTRNTKEPIFEYLKSRNFHYYPKILSDSNDDYQMMEYIEEVDMPREQKMSDLVDLLSLLHSKTTHFKEVDEDEYKKLYEDIKNNIVYLKSYYNDYISVFESKVFMSPSEYLFARNISEIFSALYFVEEELDRWYDLVKEKTKQRYVVLHNNLDLTHFLRNENSYFISWEKAKYDIPIFDLYKLYKRNALEYDFPDLFKRYECNYPLKEDERRLFFILISLPDKIDFDKSEYEMCREISRSMDLLFKTEKFISPYYAEKRKDEKQK